MKHFLLLFALVTDSLYLQAQAPALVPKPVQLTVTDGGQTFKLKSKLSLSVPVAADDSIAAVGRAFAAYLEQDFGRKVSLKKNSSKADIVLRLNSSLKPEAYTLTTTSKQVCIEAARPAGF